MNALTLVVCGAPLASRSADIASALSDAGWEVLVVGTPASRPWVDEGRIRAVTGHHLVYEQRPPTQQRRGVRPDRVVVCPLTLNTGSKLATAIMDSVAAGTLCEALATRTPLIAVPMVNERLWDHPAWQIHLRVLRDAGVRFLDARSGKIGDPHPVASGTSDDLVREFDARCVVDAIGHPGEA